MKKRIDIITNIASLAGACIGALIVYICNININMTTLEGKCIWTGLFFSVIFACGYIGMQISFAFKKKYKIKQKYFITIPVALLCAGAMFLTGAQGQFYFVESTEKVTVEETVATVDMVMLIDSSGSMFGFQNARNQAACRFVESLPEETSLRVVSFGSVVAADSSDTLLEMTDANKSATKDFINNSDLTGGTNFDLPLADAFACLKNDARDDSRKLVILLTDGDASIDNTVYSDYENGEFSLYSIRINNLSSVSTYEQRLIDLANATGGFDQHLKPDSKGNIDADKMVKAFEDIFKAESETTTEIIKHEPMLPYSAEELSTRQTVIKFAVVAICVILSCVGFCARPCWSDVIMNVITGVCCAVVMYFSRDMGEFWVYFVFVLVGGMANVRIDLSGADNYDV